MRRIGGIPTAGGGSSTNGYTSPSATKVVACATFAAALIDAASKAVAASRVTRHVRAPNGRLRTVLTHRMNQSPHSVCKRFD